MDRSVVNKMIVLKLNKSWQTVGQCSVKRAIIDLAAGVSAKALAFEYGEFDEDGQPIGDPISIVPTDWDEWVTLKVRPWEDGVTYANGNKVLRAPTVLVAKNFNAMPKKTFRGNPSKEGVLIRDNYIDQYTGKKLKREEATIDHVIPRSKGGKDSWDNLVATHREINFKKGNLLNHEAGLHLLRRPETPGAIPLSLLIREAKHRDWKPFLVNVAETAG
jgi:hypothetical protein